MLETLINPKKAERRPWEMLFIGILYSTLAMLISNFLFYRNPTFEKYTSFGNIIFTVIFSIPFFYYIIKLEEDKDIKIKCSGKEYEGKLFKEHSKALLALLFLFLGYTITFSTLYLVLPNTMVSSNFKLQAEIFCSVNAKSGMEGCINNYLSGHSSGLAVASSGFADVLKIFSNNFYVMIFILIFSLLFGAGSIFILVWNAGAIAIAIGIFAKNLIHLPAGFFVYMIHGLPEIAAYFIVALAGGIISVAMIRHHFKEEKFGKVMKDSLRLIIIAIIILIVAALIEVFITPKFF